jgi:hypothetical protein
MGLIGFGIGPALSGLQIALQRAVAPAQIGAAMGTLLLMRQVGGAVALAAAETIYVAGLHGHAGAAPAATATGSGVLVVGLAGSAIAAAALFSLTRRGGRLPAFATAR